MNMQAAQDKIIAAYEDGDTLKIIILIIRFGTELLHFLQEYIKNKKNENTASN